MAVEHVAWLNGEFIPLSQAKLSVLDAGVTTGATVTERLRTFRHEPFLLGEHVERLLASAKAAFIPAPATGDELGLLIRDVVRRNAALIDSAEDLSISAFLTAGVEGKPTLCVHATVIPAASVAAAFEQGVALVVPSTRAMSPETLSPQIKTRSRLHWHIADAEAAQKDATAKALLCDAVGNVTETATGNIFAVRHGQLSTPRRARTLHGISQSFVARLAKEQGLAVVEEDLRLDDLLSADEAYVTSSVYCMLPVVRIDGTPIGDGRAGPVYHRLLAAW